MIKKEIALGVGEAEPILSRFFAHPLSVEIATCLPTFDPYHCEYIRSIPLHFLSPASHPDGKISYEWKIHYFDLFLN